MSSSSAGHGRSPEDLAARFERAAGRSVPPPASGAAVSISQPPELSVALASYNRREGLARALDALAQQTLPSDRFEVIVVLDGSTDGSAEMVRARSDPFELKLVEQENSGLSATRNRGAAEAGRDVIVFVDDDILLHHDCLAAYADEHAERGPGDVVLGVAWTEVGADVWSGMVRDWWDRHYRRKADPGHRWTFVDVADGMASVPRMLFLETGGFDEAFRERHQDWEWGIRLFEHGARFSQSLNASGVHLIDTSVRTMVRYARQEGRSDVQLGTKHPDVRGRLFLARFASAADRPGRRARAVFTGAAVSELGARAAAPIAAGLARARATPALERLVGRLRLHGYVMGMRDGLGTVAALDEFLLPVLRREHAETVHVDLAHPAPLAVPPVGGALDLAVAEDGQELARVPAILPGHQWDWDALTERVVGAVGSGTFPRRQ